MFQNNTPLKSLIERPGQDFNEGTLPEGLTLAALKRSHSSRPRNPIIADVSFKGGYIDAWGRGTIKILDTCQQADLPEPEMKEEKGILENSGNKGEGSFFRLKHSSTIRSMNERYLLCRFDIAPEKIR